MTNAQWWRLDSNAPGLANAFRKASPEKRLHATLVACETIVPIVGLDANEEVSDGLRALREGRSSNSALQERLTALSERFDNEYFRLHEGGSEAERTEARRFFAKARGASALAFALSGDTLHEAVYEAISALVGDPSKVLRAVEKALST